MWRTKGMLASQEDGLKLPVGSLPAAGSLEAHLLVCLDAYLYGRYRVTYYTMETELCWLCLKINSVTGMWQNREDRLHKS